MAVENQIIIVAIGMLFGLIVQNSDKGTGAKLFANIIYLTSGTALTYYSVVEAGDAYVGAAIGITIILGSIIKATIEIIPKNINKQ